MKIRPQLIIWGFSLLFLTGCTRLYSQAELKGDLIPLLKTIQPAVLKIVTYDITRDIQDLGTGFFVDIMATLSRIIMFSRVPTLPM